VGLADVGGAPAYLLLFLFSESSIQYLKARHYGRGVVNIGDETATVACQQQEHHAPPNRLISEARRNLALAEVVAEVGQDGKDTSVHRAVLRDVEFSENGVDVLLDSALTDEQRGRE